MAQSVEHVLGKDGVTSSNLVISSIKSRRFLHRLFFYLIAVVEEMSFGRSEKRVWY